MHEYLFLIVVIEICLWMIWVFLNHFLVKLIRFDFLIVLEINCDFWKFGATPLEWSFVCTSCSCICKIMRLDFDLKLALKFPKSCFLHCFCLCDFWLASDVVLMLELCCDIRLEDLDLLIVSLILWFLEWRFDWISCDILKLTQRWIFWRAWMIHLILFVQV